MALAIPEHLVNRKTFVKIQFNKSESGSDPDLSDQKIKETKSHIV